MTRPQDIYLLLVLVRCEALHHPTSVRALASAAGMSASDVHRSLKRLEASGLWRRSRGVRRATLLRYLEFGVRFAYPVAPGPITHGVATAASAFPEIFRLDEAGLVWPHPDGAGRGHAIAPLHAGAARVAMEDPALHRALAAVDCLRVGKARERAHGLRTLTDWLAVERAAA
jgi:DNA-binding MarR family transcriptional regulator